MRKEKIKINHAVNKSGDTTTNPTEIQNSIVTEIENLEEMKIFLGASVLPSQNMEVLQNIIRTILSKEIEVVIKNLFNNKIVVEQSRELSGA